MNLDVVHLAATIPAETVTIEGGQQRRVHALLRDAGVLDQGYAAQAAALAPKEQAPTAEPPQDEAMLGRIGAQAGADMDRVNSGDGSDRGKGVYYHTNAFPAQINAMLTTVAAKQGVSVDQLSGEMFGAGYANSNLFEPCGAQGKGVRFRYVLKGDASPYAAVHAFVDGFTVADCASTAMAIQLRAVAVEMGQTAFDKMFKGWTGPFIAQKIVGTPLEQLATAHAPTSTKDAPAGDVAHVAAGGKTWPVRLGDKAYVMNHIDYIALSPGGLWSGEHVVCVGIEERQGKKVPLWSGFGLSAATAEEMLHDIASAYVTVASSNADYLSRHFNMRSTGSNGEEIKKKLLERFKDPSGQAGLKIDDTMLYSWHIDTAKVAAARRANGG